MKRTPLIIAAWLCGLAVAAAQPMGNVQGVVIYRGDGPIAGAVVLLSGVSNGMGPHHHPHFRQMTNAAGQFSFPGIPAGVYCISAGARMNGHAASVIEVIGGQTTNVTLFLQTRDSTWYEDSLAVVQLVGRVQVVQDTVRPPNSFYFLDVDEDRLPDYRLSFGPPWYNPPGPVRRPDNGDNVTIVGGLLTYADPPTVVVFMINGAPWRDIRGGGHGGHGGYRPYTYEHCNGEISHSNPLFHEFPAIIEILGVVEIPLCVPPPNNPPGIFAFRTAGAQERIYLNFGVDWTGIPGNGVETVHIVGGLIVPDMDSEPWVIVYEMNGQFVREPGDTTNLVAMGVAAKPIPPIPASHLTAVNYPNPFNAATTIEYTIPISGQVELDVFDVTGRLAATLVNGYCRAGVHTVLWDGGDSPSGIYLYRVNLNGTTTIGRMVLLK